MELKLIEHDLGDHDHAYVVPLSDLHEGHPNCDKPKFRGYRDWILGRDNAFATIGGDMMDCVLLNSPGSRYEATMSPDDQMESVIVELRPLAEAKKILIIVGGNHEERISRDAGIDVCRIIARELKVPYVKDMACLALRVGKLRNGKKAAYTVGITHGVGGGRTQGGKAAALERFGGVGCWDIYIMGHVHSMTTFQRLHMVPDLQNGNIIKKKQTFVSSGSYLGYGDYGARGMFSPAKLGSPRIRLSGRGEKDVHVSI